jgi:hypothetical protein
MSIALVRCKSCRFIEVEIAATFCSGIDDKTAGVLAGLTGIDPSHHVAVVGAEPGTDEGQPIE